jgi:hypothetical protein
VTFTTQGVLRYSPKLLGDRQSEKWWLVVDCDSEIGKYYRHLVHLGLFKTRKLMRPAWDMHVTVIRNEEPSDERKSLWGKHSGEVVNLCVSGGVETNGDYWWLPVSCDRLLDIREELGLPRLPSLPLHLSVGHGEQ